jgi:hypothetical protein
MAVGRISGPLLKANLERNGIDLAVETDLLYIDVTNNRIGINKNSPGCDLDVNGTICSDRINTDFLTVQNNYNLGNVNITSTVGDLELAPATGSDRTKVLGDLEVTGNIIGLNFNDAFTIVDDTSTATNVELGQTLHFQSGADIDVVAGSDQINFSVTSTLDSVTGRGNTTTNDITVNDLISNGTVYTSTIDSSDSSAITVTPKMVFSSDATVENTLTVGNDVYITGNTTSAGDVTAVRFFGDGSALTNLTASYVNLTDTNTTGRTTGSLTRFDGANYIPTQTVEDASGNITVSGQINVSTIDTTDSSAVTVVPAATFNSDVTVENDINLTNNLEVNNIQQTSANEETLSTTAAQTITHFDGSVFSSGKLIVQVRDNVTSEVQVCQISIIHDTVTASTTEYSNLFTGANPLASFAATIRGADVHLDATGASTNSTTYKVLKTLIRFL